MRRAVPLLLIAALTAGCADIGAQEPAGTGATPRGAAGSANPSGGPAASASTAADGAFAAYTAGARAITYDPTVVPPGAVATVTVTPAGDTVAVELSVSGMLPGRTYGAHLHTDACGATAADAGPHYQHRADPAAAASPPSVDPRYANPTNEVWLDFTTDTKGAAAALAKQRPFTAAAPPRSLVIHADRTATGPGKAGMAGPRVACLTLTA